MKRTIIIAAALAALSAGGRAQSFPFQEAFSAYGPGSTGAPAWSALEGRWQVPEGALRGPVVVRFNQRPPHEYAMDATLRGAAGAKEWQAGLILDMQREDRIDAADEIDVRVSGGKVTVEARPGGATGEKAVDAAQPVKVTAVVDSDTGRLAVFVNGAPCVASAAEYAGGLTALALRNGAEATAVALRTPTDDERRAVRTTTLFSDPRDVADAGDGNIMVLHRGSPAVLVVTPDGEVIRSFGRRMPGAVPDPVAMKRGTHGEILVLNRFPGEVVVYERNGGIRYRFGAGKLVEPTDLVVLPDGTVYVADPGARAVVAYTLRGQYLGAPLPPSKALPRPRRLALDAMGNLLALCPAEKRVLTLRPEADRARLTQIADAEGNLDAALAVGGAVWALADGSVSQWPVQPDRPVFRGTAVGGLGRGRMAMVRDTVYLLDRSRSRLLALPRDLRDVQPEVSFQNVAQTVALVRWQSAAPALESTVRLLRGSTWDTITQRLTVPTTQHQVLLERLQPGRTYRYTISPTTPAIPSSDAAVEFTFTTAPAKETAK